MYPLLTRIREQKLIRFEPEANDVLSDRLEHLRVLLPCSPHGRADHPHCFARRRETSPEEEGMLSREYARLLCTNVSLSVVERFDSIRTTNGEAYD